jgi:glycosyltransferase involved in cell wall biosynthesis
VRGRAEVLFVSPVVPAFTGNGLAMRAGLVLEALSARCAVSLLVFRLYAGPAEDVAPELRRVCSRVAVVPPPRRANRPGWWVRHAGALAPFRRAPFDAVHVFRLATLPLVRWLMEGRRPRPRLDLDLDDIESVTHARIAELCRANGDGPAAIVEEAKAKAALAAEQEALLTVDRVYLCSEADRQRLARCGGSAELRVLPNGVHIPAVLPPPVSPPFRFLFIGTLGYYPNEDAALLLCRSIGPAIQRLSSMDVQFDIAGGGASLRLREAARAAGIRLLGAVPEVRPVYESAGALVTPLRVGGGTRIKILEALSFGRAVVSTSIGAEGLDVTHGKEVLIADSPDEFAAACARLALDRDLQTCLAARGRDFVNASYSRAAMERCLEEPGG